MRSSSIIQSFIHSIEHCCVVSCVAAELDCLSYFAAANDGRGCVALGTTREGMHAEGTALSVVENGVRAPTDVEASNDEDCTPSCEECGDEG